MLTHSLLVLVDQMAFVVVHVCCSSCTVMWVCIEVVVHLLVLLCVVFMYYTSHFTQIKQYCN